jgi:CRISPR-associated protein Cmr3
MGLGYIKITPFDGLFFGKGRPFSMGDESWTEARLFPSPAVIWGALFSQLWYQDNNTPLDVFRIGKIMLLGENISQCYLPAPLDIFKADEQYFHHNFIWQEDEQFLTAREEQNVLLSPTTDDQIKLPDDTFINAASLQRYADSHLDFQGISLIPMQQLIGQENKIGIGRDTKRKAAEEGKMYFVSLSHLVSGYSFVVEAEFPDSFPKSGVMKLGGEGKMAQYHRIDEHDKGAQAIRNSLQIQVSSTPVNFFKLYLTSPSPLDENGLPSFLKNSGFRIEAGVTGKPYLLGGFDYKYRRPKPKRLCAPAGSVYILEYTSDADGITPDDAKKELNQKSSNIGFDQFEIIPYDGNKE